MIPSHVVLATANAGKLLELGRLVREWGGVKVVSLADCPAVTLPPEGNLSYEENAVAKARAVASATGLPALGDDSGLEVEALGWGPGIHSARYAADDRARIARVLRELGGVSSSTARFRCVVALAWPDGRTECAEGVIVGRIAAEPAGAAGFGYDPVFVPDGLDHTFGEAEPVKKAQLSHRARAMHALGARLRARAR